MHRRSVLFGIGLAFLLAAGNSSFAAAQQVPVTTKLIAENNSGVSGTATLTDLGDGRVRVDIRADGTGADARPAHIHMGACSSGTADMSMSMGMGNDESDSPQYALTPLVNGLSNTDVPVSLSDVLATPHSIEVHKSSDQIGFEIACADLLPPQPQSMQPQAMPAQRVMTTNLVSENQSGVTGTAALSDLGDGRVRIVIHAVGTGSDPRPAHVHEGQCMTDSGDMAMGMGMDVPAPEYALTTLVNGDSSTDLNVALGELIKTPHAIHIHKSPDEIGFHIACADLQALKMTYTVADGDTLSDIARQVYGDGDRWPAIFSANRGLISNPNKIFRGQVLTINP